MLSIGMLAKRTATHAPTIRYYEKIGLLERPARRHSGHRTYTERDVQRLKFIRRCRAYNLSLNDTRKLVTLYKDGSGPCSEARFMAEKHLKSIRAQIVELRRLEQDLSRFIGGCADSCANGIASDCTMFDELNR